MAGQRGHRQGKLGGCGQAEPQGARQRGSGSSDAGYGAGALAEGRGEVRRGIRAGVNAEISAGMNASSASAGLSSGASRGRMPRTWRELSVTSDTAATEASRGRLERALKSCRSLVLSVCLSVCLSACLSACLPACLPACHHPCIFAWVCVRVLCGCVCIRVYTCTNMYTYV